MQLTLWLLIHHYARDSWWQATRNTNSCTTYQDSHVVHPPSSESGGSLRPWCFEACSILLFNKWASVRHSWCFPYIQWSFIHSTKWHSITCIVWVQVEFNKLLKYHDVTPSMFYLSFFVTIIIQTLALTTKSVFFITLIKLSDYLKKEAHSVTLILILFLIPVLN